MSRAAGDIIHQGTLHKVGGSVKSWTKRWMILKKDNVLYYYKDPAKSPLGSISLSNPNFLVMEGRKTDLNWPKAAKIERTLIIMTSYRIYYMYADTQQEAAEWIEQLQNAADSIPGKNVTKRAEPKPSGVAITNGKDDHSKTSSISSSLSASVESICDAANNPDSNRDCSISTDEENGPEHNGYNVPPSNEPAGEDDIYELADNLPSHSQPSDPPPLPPDDDDDEDTVPLPRPPLSLKNSGVSPPVPQRGSAAKLTNGGDDSPPMVPLKKKAAASSLKATHANTNKCHDYSQLDKIESEFKYSYNVLVTTPLFVETT